MQVSGIRRFAWAQTKVNPGGKIRRGCFSWLADGGLVFTQAAGGDDVLNVEIDDLDLRILELH